MTSFEIQGYAIEDRRFALPILESSFPTALSDLESALSDFRIGLDEIVEGGGGEARHTQRLRKALSSLGWTKKNISTKQTVKVENVSRNHAAESSAEYVLPSESHEVDHVKGFEAGTVALEIEWNNKDPFYDRDLENFRRLHHIGLVRVGIIITRGPELQNHLRDIFVTHYSDDTIYRTINDVGCTPKQRITIERRVSNGEPIGAAAGHVLFQNKYGAATTHWDKLIDRVDGRLLGNPCPLLLIGIEHQRIQSIHADAIEAPKDLFTS